MSVQQLRSLRPTAQEEEEEEEEERDEVARDEEMAEANGDAGGAGALSLANGAGPLHDEDDEEPENAVVLHEVCASLYWQTVNVLSSQEAFHLGWQESLKGSEKSACFGTSSHREQ